MSAVNTRPISWRKVAELKEELKEDDQHTLDGFVVVRHRDVLVCDGRGWKHPVSSASDVLPATGSQIPPWRYTLSNNHDGSVHDRRTEQQIRVRVNIQIRFRRRGLAETDLPHVKTISMQHFRPILIYYISIQRGLSPSQ